MAQFFPNAATEWLAEVVQGELALSKIRLWQNGEITPSIATTRAELVAAEADFTGYTAGGEALTAWFDPLNNPIGGSSIDSEKVQFQTATPYTTANTIGGFWVETAAGELVVVGTFVEPIPMSGPGAGFPLSASIVFPN